jgi:hypothetical protein
MEQYSRGKLVHTWFQVPENLVFRIVFHYVLYITGVQDTKASRSCGTHGTHFCIYVRFYIYFYAYRSRHTSTGKVKFIQKSEKAYVPKI